MWAFCFLTQLFPSYSPNEFTFCTITWNRKCQQSTGRFIHSRWARCLVSRHCPKDRHLNTTSRIGLNTCCVGTTAKGTRRCGTKAYSSRQCCTLTVQAYRRDTDSSALANSAGCICATRAAAELGYGSAFLKPWHKTQRASTPPSTFAYTHQQCAKAKKTELKINQAIVAALCN